MTFLLDAAVVETARTLLFASHAAPRAMSMLAAHRGLVAADSPPAAPASAPPSAAPASAVPSAAPIPTVAPTSAPLPSASSSTSTAAASGGEFPTILLTCLIWSSLAVGLVVLLLPDRTADDRGRIRVTALVGVALPLVAAAGGINYQINQDLTGGTTSFEEFHQWITDFPVKVDYHLSVDGVSLPLLLLTTVMFTVAVLASWRSEQRVKLYLFLLLLLETGVTGALCSSDYVLFLLFFALESVPVFLLISIWGGPRRVAAAWKYLGFSLTSSALLLVMVVIAGFEGKGSTEFLQTGGTPLGSGLIFAQGIVGAVCFWLSFTAFGIKLPVVPLHSWLPDAAAEASPPVAAIISGVLVNLGGYGMIRVMLAGFSAPAKQFGLVLAALAAVTALWGTISAIGLDDLKRLIAYGSIGHMAIVLLAVSSESSIALNGAVLQMVANGFTTGMLILLAGTVEERTRTRSIRRLGGLAWQAPRLTVLWVFAGLASLGLPLLAGFVAEFEIFTGAFAAHRVMTLIVMASVIVTTGYLLWVLQRVFFGPAKEAFQRVRDATTLELIYLLPLVFFIVLFGVLPGRVIPIIQNGVQTITSRLSG